MTKYSMMLLFALAVSSCNTNEVSYFNQEPPSQAHQLFAPSLVNTDSIELNVVFNEDHSEMFFSRIVNNSFVIHHSERIDGQWSGVEPLQLYPDSISVSVACDPTITRDGKTMYFLGVDPELYDNDVSRKELYTIPPDIYRSNKKDGKWQIATKVDYGVSTEYLETYPIVVADGSLYFRSNRPSEEGGMHAYRAQYMGNGAFDAPVIINTQSEKNELITYVSRNEQYAITNGQGRFQITFNDDGVWTKPKEVPLDYEDGWRYYCPYMTADGKYFMFSRRYNNPQIKGWAGVEKGEVYWVSADVLFHEDR